MASKTATSTSRRATSTTTSTSDPHAIHAVPSQAAVPEPAFRTTRSFDYDGDRLHARRGVRALEVTYRSTRRARTLERLSYSDGDAVLRVRPRRHRPPSRRPGTAPDPHAKFDDWAIASGYAPVGSHVRVTSTWSVYGDEPTLDVHDSTCDGGVEPTRRRRRRLRPRRQAVRRRARRGRRRSHELRRGARPHDTSGYWAACYKRETPYQLDVRRHASSIDPDTDGDDVRDGADDQDHDDVPNLMELQPHLAAGLTPDRGSSTAGCGDDRRRRRDLERPVGRGRVNPFNPCLPYSDSRTCKRHPPIDKRLERRSTERDNGTRSTDLN